MIDHIIIPSEHYDYVLSCEILDDDALNVSNHRPLFCKFQLPILSHSTNDVHVKPRLKWAKATSKSLIEYESFLEENVTLSYQRNVHISLTGQIDELYNILVSEILKSSDLFIPKTKFKRFLKPYWNDDLSKLHKTMMNIRSKWILDNRPRSNNSQTYKAYKHAKNKFRNCHRQAAENYLVTLNQEIDESAEVDSSTFWKLLKLRKPKSCTSAGNEIKFDDTIIRDPVEIVSHWGSYFKKLYTPSDNIDYDNVFKDNVSEHIKRLNNKLFNGDYIFNDNYNISVDEVTQALKKAKKAKACGDDNIYYEHLIYTGSNVRYLLAKLFTAMLKFSYVPTRMKVGTIITLFKGGNKLRTDPNNYRAITLSSVFIRVYENILIKRIDIQGNIKVDKLQGGFQKNLGCVMTSFSLKKCILYGKEQNSRVFICFFRRKESI